MNVFELYAKIGLDTSEYNKSLETAEKSTSDFGEKLKKGIGVAAGVATAGFAATTVAAVGSAKAFLGGVANVASYGDHIDKLSQKMNMSATSFQEWDFIMQHSGTSIESMQSSIKTLSNAATTGNEAFKKLGISQKDIANMSGEELFSATITALQNVDNETERTYLAGKLLGRGATELGALLNMSAEETEAMKKQVHDLGGVLSDEAVKDAANYQDQLQNMNTALDGVKRNMLSQFLPGISSVMSGLAKVFSGNGGMEEVQKGLESVVQNIANVAPQFFQLAEVLVTSLLNGFAPMLPQLVSSIFSFLNQAILTLVGMVPQLTPVITEGIKGISQALLTALPVIAQALIQMTQELVTWLASGDNVKTFVDGILQLVSVLAQSFGDMLPVLIPALVNIIGQIADSLTDPKNVNMIITSILYIVGAIVVALVKALPEIGGVIVKLTVNIGKTIADWGGKLFSSIGSWLSSVWTKAGQWFGTLVGNIALKLGEVWQGIREWFVKLPSKISEAFKATVNTIKGWASSAVQWGKDMIGGFIKGIKESASKMASVIKNFAKDNISKFLHFSVPDAGPLADADKWMPDFVDLMTTGLEKNAPKMRSAVQDFAGSINSNMRAGVQSVGQSGAFYGSTISINVYGAEGQDVRELAKAVSKEIQNLISDKERVYA